MIKLINNPKLQIFPIGLVLILALSRLIPHPPNFTPIIAVAIMSGYLFRNVYLSFATLFFSMLISDLFIGFYPNIIFVYASLCLITFLFFKINNKISFKNLFIFGFCGALIFFLISNFGVWLVAGLYEKSLKGLIECYVLAIPFFYNTLISTIFFVYLSFFVNIFFKKRLNQNSI